ncbi:VENN motif pre-toxin domain-containing protein [Rosenbergiella nectarea]|uniref:VENN motif pre-toxin domain-containing protein n=1 Tax=Rosenbergiella nectarea TaxID=988801 RepID=UPI0030B8AC3F
MNKVDKERDQAIRAVCTDGQKGGGACGALIGPAQDALNKYGEKATYSLLYKDLYPQDLKNLEGILQGLDAGSISRDQAITAIAKSSGKSWNEVAKQYDSAMQAQSIVVALAGMKGIQLELNVNKAQLIKPSRSTTSSFDANEIRFSQNTVSQTITASTAAIQGLAGGDLAKALAGGAAPYLAQEIHKRTIIDGEVNKTANLMAHAVVNAALSLAKGENALAGASSAVTAEAVGLISKSYYDKKPTELKEDEKQTISALASLAAGLAGGLVGGDTASAVSGMQTGKVTVENNSLGDIAQAQSEGKTVEQKASEYVEAENERYKKANCGGMSAEACSVKMYTERREALKNTLSTGADFLPIIGTIKSAAEAQSALDYLNVAASLIPGERVASGVLKAAEKALVKGDVTEASKLINKASDEIKVKWVDENASMSQRARDYNDSASGARSNIETQKGQAPSIDRVDANGLNKPVRFDGVDGNVMIDRKISVVTTQKAKDQAIRQSEALKNNGMTGRWEVPTQAQANRAQKMFDELGIKNIEVKVVNE